MMANTTVCDTLDRHGLEQAESGGETAWRFDEAETGVSVTPAVRGNLVVYARVSTKDQDLARQHTELSESGCGRVFQDHGVSGAAMVRPGLTDALAYLRPGDSLTVVSLDRLGRDTAGLLALTRQLTERGVGLRILGLGLDTATPTGRLVLSILAAVAEMERALIRERVASGLAEARRQGRVGGRPPKLSEAQQRFARRLRAEDGMTYAAIGELMGCSTRTILRIVRGTA